MTIDGVTNSLVHYMLQFHSFSNILLNNNFAAENLNNLPVTKSAVNQFDYVNGNRSAFDVSVDCFFIIHRISFCIFYFRSLGRSNE